MTRRSWFWIVVVVAFIGIAAGVFLRRQGAAIPPAHDAVSKVSAGQGVSILDPDNPCGPVAVALVGHLLGKPVSLAEARRLVPADSLGRTSAAALLEGLGALGIPAAAVQVAPEAAVKLDAPFIVFLDQSHFGVLIPAAGGEWYLADPPQPIRRPTTEELASQWTGEAILVARDDEHLAENLRRLGLAP